ncbi:MAG: 4Fe-4S binding protein [Spirochaetaceae bacterium]|nr:MAG: 4Fe-4S binding protein [Spirochaetaceae bacterium]
MVRKIVLGNAAIAEAALASGVDVVTGYPGTPTSELIPCLTEIVLAEKLPVYVEWSVNEKVALDVAVAAAWAGKRALSIMKMAGLNVAADTLINVAYKGVSGALVLYVADDPGTHAGCTEQDSRYYAFLAQLPLLDAADPADAYRLTRLAFEISEQLGLPVLLRSTTNVAHTMGVIEGEPYHPDQSRRRDFHFQKKIEQYTTIEADRGEQHRQLLAKLESFADTAQERGLNRLEKKGSKGVIASGVSWTYLLEGIRSFDLNVTSLKIDNPHPWPEETVRRLIEHADSILVLEEQEPILERMLKRTMADMSRSLPVLGKEDGTLPRTGEYDFEIVAAALSKLTGRRLGFEPIAGIETAGGAEFAYLKSLRPRRALTFCSGCPHRATYYIINQVVRKLGYRQDEVIVTGDIGCTSLGTFQPLRTLWTEVTMGAAIGLAHGFKTAGAPKPVIATLGDSTFFHSGIPPLVNAVQHGSDLTVIVLDNHWTAMTGFQPNPNTGLTALGKTAPALSIPRIVEALGIPCAVIDPFEVQTSIDTITEIVRRRGVKVVVSQAECTLQKRRGDGVDTPYRILEPTCTDCGACIRTLACPAIAVADGLHRIDPAACSGCGLCVFVCPHDAIERVEG